MILKYGFSRLYKTLPIFGWSWAEERLQAVGDLDQGAAGTA